jgi:predicted RNase H-like HicB family nuclease
MKTSRFTAILEGDPDGYYAYCPELKGCQTQGETVEEALANLRELRPRLRRAEAGTPAGG